MRNLEPYGRGSERFIVELLKLLPAVGGTYTLFFRNPSSLQLQVGSLRLFVIEPGILIYEGRPSGPGGLLSRISHHLRVSKNPRWHVNYLRTSIPPVEVWYSVDPLTANTFGARSGRGWKASAIRR